MNEPALTTVVGGALGAALGCAALAIIWICVVWPIAITLEVYFRTRRKKETER